MTKKECSCGSKQTEFINKGPHVGLYCSDCGQWLQWVSKKQLEIMMKE